jgi:hypothetical protein
MREHPDHHDAELLLRLYDLRREERLRRGRDWLIREFQAKSAEEYFQQCPPGSETSALFRMTITYWDMAASIVNDGLIKEEFFFENTGEFWIAWDKVRNFAPTLRENFKNPYLWKNLETLAEKYEQWMSKRAPEALDSQRKRLRGATPPKSA